MSSCGSPTTAAGSIPELVPAVLAGAGGGIGLSNVDARLRATFGERYALTIESEPGRGTTVVMTVPNLAGSEALALTHDRGAAVTADRLTVLAVDDERSQLEDLARLLRSSPSVREVECAADGRDALAKVSSQPFDAIFLDVRMPDLDGLELARVLRRFATAPQLVFVSAHDGAAVEAFELHALDYLRKPVARRRVEEAIERVAAAVDANPAAGQSSVTQPPASQDEMVAVANGGSTRLLARSTIEFVQSYGDFVRIVTADGRYLLRDNTGRDRAPVGAVWLRARASSIRSQPAQRDRAATADRRDRRAHLRRRPDDPRRPAPHGGTRATVERLTALVVSER